MHVSEHAPTPRTPIAFPSHENNDQQHERILPHDPGPLPTQQGVFHGDRTKVRPAFFLYRPCLCVAAGIKWLPVVFIVSIVAWSYYAFVVQLSILTVESIAEKTFTLIVYHAVLVLFSTSYWQTIFAPSSVVPASWKLSTAMLERLKHAKTEAEWKSFLELFVVEMELPVAERSVQGAIRYCEKCTAIKPDRSHHCSVCGTCVLKMDHHCPWVNNCVAFNNYKFFTLFLGYSLVYCVFVACCTFKYFMSFWTDEWRIEGSGKFHILFLFVVSVMFCISVSSLFWYHIFLVLRNRSTLEQFRSPYFAGIGMDAEGWSLGKANNFREVFGYNKFLWFLPVHTSVGDGLTFPSRLHCEARSYNSTSDARDATAAQNDDDCVVDLDASNNRASRDFSTESDGTFGSANPPNNPSLPQPPNQVVTQWVLENGSRVTTKVGTPRSLSSQ